MARFFPRLPLNERSPVDWRMVVTMMEAGDWAFELIGPLTMEAGDYVWNRVLPSSSGARTATPFVTKEKAPGCASSRREEPLYSRAP